MGTRGLRLVRYERRYWVYYNHWDSYPEGLGASVVAEIPIEPEKYQEWLAKMREEYQRKTQVLEDRILVIPGKDVRGKTGDEEVEEEDEDEDEEKYEEDKVPRELCNNGLDLFIEWTYLIDLDEELFVIDNQVIFPLRNIPRDRWLLAFSQDLDSGELEALGSNYGWEPDDDPVRSYDIERVDQYQRVLRFCPEATLRKGVFSCRRLGAGEGPSHCEVRGRKVRQVTVLLDQKDVPLKNFVALLVFERLTAYDKPFFWEYLHDAVPDSFAFREVAFLILSLAADQFYFQHLTVHGRVPPLDRSTYSFRQEAGRSLPVFGSEHHLKDIVPGSAPLQNMYWFAGVLVSLVTDETLENRLAEAQASAIDYAVVSGRSCFQVILFSLWHAVLFEVVDDSNGHSQVRSTRIGPVCSQHSGEYYQWSKSSDLVDEHPNAHLLNALHQLHPGFAVLQKFFKTAAEREVAGC